MDKSSQSYHSDVAPSKRQHPRRPPPIPPRHNNTEEAPSTR